MTNKEVPDASQSSYIIKYYIRFYFATCLYWLPPQNNLPLKHLQKNVIEKQNSDHWRLVISRNHVHYNTFAWNSSAKVHMPIIMFIPNNRPRPIQVKLNFCFANTFLHEILKNTAHDESIHNKVVRFLHSVRHSFWKRTSDT